MNATPKPPVRKYRLTVHKPSLGLVKDAHVYHHPDQSQVAPGRVAVSLDAHPTAASSFWPALPHEIEEIKA
jgi:hypothetical protein